MFNQQKICVYLVILICLTGVVFVSADKKVLKILSGTLREETISLDNDDNLLVDGTFVQRFPLLLNPTHELKLNIIYIADKDGYRAKYILEKVGIIATTRLNPLSLKSVAG